MYAFNTLKIYALSAFVKFQHDTKEEFNKNNLFWRQQESQENNIFAP